MPCSHEVSHPLQTEVVNDDVILSSLKLIRRKKKLRIAEALIRILNSKFGKLFTSYLFFAINQKIK